MILIIKNKYDVDVVLKFQKESPRRCMFFFMERYNKYHGNSRLEEFFKNTKADIDLVVVYGRIARKHKAFVESLTDAPVLSL